MSMAHIYFQICETKRGKKVLCTVSSRNSNKTYPLSYLMLLQNPRDNDIYILLASVLGKLSDMYQDLKSKGYTCRRTSYFQHARTQQYFSELWWLRGGPEAVMGPILCMFNF